MTICGICDQHDLRSPSGIPRGQRRRAGWRAIPLNVCGVFLGVLCLLASHKAQGFALLGPYAPWMTLGVGYDPAWRSPEMDIGGPMALGEEYRWNIPVVTYGFDQSFLDYFGQGGVDAVEQAIQVLNDLPPASSMVVTNYQLQAVRYNYLAQSQGFGDLKSSTLAILIEQMGLTAPIRYCYALRSWEPSLAQGALGIDGVFSQGRVADYPWITNCVVCRNYNPQSQLPSPRVNSILFAWIVRTMDLFWLEPQVETVAPPGQNYSVCDGSRYTGPGVYISRLTQEDVGGLLYLYSRTNVNVESLEDSVGQVAGNDCIRIASRPGIEKITFVRHPTDSTGGFVAWTNQFADAYFADGLLATQQVQRVVMQPDFLFSVEDFGFEVEYGTNGPTLVYSTFWFHRTGTSSWVNSKVLNGNPDGDGPGVIRPSAKISFAKPGRYVAAAGGKASGTSHSFLQWASFTTGTNIVIFPGKETEF